MLALFSSNPCETDLNLGFPKVSLEAYMKLSNPFKYNHVYQVKMIYQNAWTWTCLGSVCF